MKNNLRQNILKELKFLVEQQGSGSGEDIEVIGNNLASNKLKNFRIFKSERDKVYRTASYRDKGGVEYIALDATGTGVFGVGDNVTEAELMDYISSGAPNTAANKKMCTDSDKLVIVDGSGKYRDSLMLIKCEGIKPVSALRGKAASSSDITNAIAEFIANNQIVEKKESSPTSTVPAPEASTTIKPPVTQSGKPFRCKNREDVAVYQQFLGVEPDCVIGPLTMAKAVEKGANSNLQDMQDPAKQVSFCNSLKTHRGGYENKIIQSGLKVKKCPISIARKKPVQPNAVPAGQSTDANSSAEKQDVDSDDEFKMAGAKNLQREANTYHEKLKFNKANLLFERLMKGI